MTIEERAQKMVEDDQAYWWEDTEQVKARYVKHLRDQIEECAKLMDKQAAGFQALIDHAPTPIRAEDLKRVQRSIEVVANLIRGLAEPTEERKETER